MRLALWLIRSWRRDVELPADRTATTRMACPPPLDTLERAYLDALSNVSRWQIADDELTLADAAGNELLRFDVASAP
jgi:putative lipoprotein